MVRAGVKGAGRKCCVGKVQGKRNRAGRLKEVPTQSPAFKSVSVIDPTRSEVAMLAVAALRALKTRKFFSFHK